MLVFDLCHFEFSIVRAATRRDRRVCGLVLCKSGRREQKEHDGNLHWHLQTVNSGLCVQDSRTIRTYHLPCEVPRMSDLERLERDCACSVPKLHPTGTRQPQLGFAEMFDFLGIRWLVLYRVCAGIALITRRSSVQI
jgi:hypothetical protein